MDNNTLTIYICLLIGLLVLITAIPAARTSSIKKKMQMLADNTLEVTPQEFFKTRNASNGDAEENISPGGIISQGYISYSTRRRICFMSARARTCLVA